VVFPFALFTKELLLENVRPHAIGCPQPAGSAHGGAIESIGRPTNETDLVILALRSSVWPRELMAAKQLQKSRQQWWSHAVLSPRLFRCDLRVLNNSLSRCGFWFIRAQADGQCMVALPVRSAFRWLGQIAF
jgi:hypothetical protein